MKKLIIFLSFFLSLNLSAQFRSTSMYLDNTQQVEHCTYQSADEYLNSVSAIPNQNDGTAYYPGLHRAPGKPSDPYPTPIDERSFPLALVVLALGFGVYKFVKLHDK